MSHFLIYVQGMKTLPDVGLDHLIEGHMSVPVTEGPDGQGGTIYAWPTATDNRMNYAPQEQSWVPSVKQGDLESGSYWFGYWKDRKPEPGNLARSNQCQGVYIKMFDGNEWQIPYVESLPASLKKVNDGTVERKLHERYYDIFLEVKRWERITITEQDVPLSEYFDFIYELLKLNYRVVPELLNEMNLIDINKPHVPVLAAVLGIDAEREPALNG